MQVDSIWKERKCFTDFAPFWQVFIGISCNKLSTIIFVLRVICFKLWVLLLSYIMWWFKICIPTKLRTGHRNYHNGVKPFLHFHELFLLFFVDIFRNIHEDWYPQIFQPGSMERMSVFRFRGSVFKSVI